MLFSITEASLLATVVTSGRDLQEKRAQFLREVIVWRVASSTLNIGLLFFFLND